ncbi:Tn3 family transposase [Lederbergia sp. NSJ-179]|uniref:Tn3 family transposase n=1 Tax=Lederbergia sp. NSJ-179 TaxID=2931402 RepID=UPI001FD20557|nr:Tn3 family transposase [Lederbergia sp. NSJ-179]MCJ7841948.1 Tn3 family transposase [Lederbergia sp. NSJ-179]
MRRHPPEIRYTLLSSFFWIRRAEITDGLIELLIQIIHRINVRAERKVDKELIHNLRKVNGKNNLLFQMAEQALDNPDGIIRDVLYPDKDNLRNAIAKIVNAILRNKMTDIWGEGTTSCASDSKKFGAWDQNLIMDPRN